MTAEELGQLIRASRGTQGLQAYLAAGGSLQATEPRSGMPILHLACEHQNLEMIRALAEHGANLDFQDSYGQAPLHVAVDNDIDSVIQSGDETGLLRFETTRLLIELGANLEVRDHGGRTPRAFAAAYGPNTLEEYDRLVESLVS